MKTTIDRFGRLVLPKQIRDRIGLKPGSEIIIEALESEIVIRHSKQKAPLLYKDGVLVFAGTAVGDLTESIRKHREARLSKFAIGKKRGIKRISNPLSLLSLFRLPLQHLPI